MKFLKFKFKIIFILSLSFLPVSSLELPISYFCACINAIQEYKHQGHDWEQTIQSSWFQVLCEQIVNGDLSFMDEDILGVI